MMHTRCGKTLTGSDPVSIGPPFEAVIHKMVVPAFVGIFQYGFVIGKMSKIMKSSGDTYDLPKIFCIQRHNATPF
jgi:hypothetical protein